MLDAETAKKPCPLLERSLPNTQVFMLCGVEIYAGTIDELSMAESVSRIREVLAKAAHVTRLCDQEGLFQTSEVIFCAGCSHYFDLCQPLQKWPAWRSDCALSFAVVAICIQLAMVRRALPGDF